MPEGSTKPARAKRRARDQIGPGLAAVFRHGQELHHRQQDWNALLSLEAQERTCLVDWRGGSLQVLVESGVWLAWLRRNQKRICQRWNTRFPQDPVIRIEAVVRPWRQSIRAAQEPSTTQVLGPAPLVLKQLAENSDGALGAALTRLVKTLDQAGTEASESTKEKGARSGEE
ncbi:DciA family protein [Acidithiobacillus sp. IBUN Pt1247-S3]|uniref:DciA family protein n=1 Tax=Acidithiobacillus sp. IBUN Pt1247-S3 TaxID=3166642 RepID=UPI0034E5437D